MFCKKCGHQLNDNDQVCSNCGIEVKSKKRKIKIKFKKKYAVILAIIILLCGITSITIKYGLPKYEEKTISRYISEKKEEDTISFIKKWKVITSNDTLFDILNNIGVKIEEDYCKDKLSYDNAIAQAKVFDSVTNFLVKNYDEDFKYLYEPYSVRDGGKKSLEKIAKSSKRPSNTLEEGIKEDKKSKEAYDKIKKLLSQKKYDEVILESKNLNVYGFMYDDIASLLNKNKSEIITYVKESADRLSKEQKYTEAKKLVEEAEKVLRDKNELNAIIENINKEEKKQELGSLIKISATANGRYYSNYKDLLLDIDNVSNKTIKYVDIEVEGQDQYGKPIEGYRRDSNVHLVGPFAPGSKLVDNSVYYMTFWPDYTAKVKVTKVSITFEDGQEETYTGDDCDNFIK